MAKETITRSYLKTLEGTPIFKEYPKHLEWDGVKEATDYLGDIIYYSSYIMENIYHNLEVRETITKEEALDLFIQFQGVFTELYFNLIGHTDGEQSEGGKYLLEAWVEEDKEKGELFLTELKQLYNKVIGEG